MICMFCDNCAHFSLISTVLLFQWNCENLLRQGNCATVIPQILSCWSISSLFSFHAKCFQDLSCVKYSLKCLFSNFPDLHSLPGSLNPQSTRRCWRSWTLIFMVTTHLTRQPSRPIGRVSMTVWMGWVGSATSPWLCTHPSPGWGYRKWHLHRRRKTRVYAGSSTYCQALILHFVVGTGTSPGDFSALPLGLHIWAPPTLLSGESEVLSIQ